jgi:hypothetical protein
MEAKRSSETSLLRRPTRRHIPEDGALQTSVQLLWQLVPMQSTFDTIWSKSFTCQFIPHSCLPLGHVFTVLVHWYLSNVPTKMLNFLSLTKHRESFSPHSDRTFAFTQSITRSFILWCLCMSGLSNFKALRDRIIFYASTRCPIIKHIPPFFLTTPVQLSALQ